MLAILPLRFGKRNRENSMEDVLKLLAQQVPGLVVLVYLVIQFTKTIREMVKAFREELGDFKKSIERSNRVIELNTDVLNHVKNVLKDKQ